MTIVRWGSYELPITLLSSEISGLANNGISAPGVDIVNSGGSLYCDLEFVGGAAFSPVQWAMLDIWMLRSLDGGLSYEDGSSSVPPPREPDAGIAVRSGSNILVRAGMPQLVLPPGHYKPIARNRLGVNIPNGSLVRLASYTEVAV